MGDSYDVIIGNDDKTSSGLISPKKQYGIYTQYINEQVIASIPEEYDHERIRKELSLESIEENLSNKEEYTVDVVCKIDGRRYYKCFIYYAVDKNLKSYLCLQTDVSDILTVEKVKNEQLKIALEESKQASIAKSAFFPV